ncbi:hypothetical protein NT04LM_1915 [Listeria monocytogenes FSL F2-208]|nr:hypothetical protein NT04LM_1915 [Listeria monocytogenes FSL F2-208]
MVITLQKKLNRLLGFFCVFKGFLERNCYNEKGVYKEGYLYG